MERTYSAKRATATEKKNCENHVCIVSVTLRGFLYLRICKLSLACISTDRD
jgi:hypothetical protein